jgi:hypothetical protein
MYEHSNNNILSCLSVCPCAEEPQARSACLGNNYKLKNKIIVRDQGYVQDYDVARLKGDYST